MKHERKCSNCQQWSTNEDFCPYCQTALDSQAIIKASDLNRAARQKKQEPARIDKILSHMANSPYLIVRLCYWLLRTIWTVYFIILSAILWFIALLPG